MMTSIVDKDRRVNVDDMIQDGSSWVGNTNQGRHPKTAGTKP